MSAEYTVAIETCPGLAACHAGGSPPANWQPATAVGKLLAQTCWLGCHLQVIGSLLGEAERVMEHPPLTLDSTTSTPGGPQLWAAALRELMPALADAPSFHGSYSLGNSSVFIYGFDQGFLDCKLAGAACWRPSVMSGSTQGHDSQLLGLHHVTSLVRRH